MTLSSQPVTYATTLTGDNISETMHDRDMVTTDHNRKSYSLSIGIIADDLDLKQILCRLSGES